MPMSAVIDQAGRLALVETGLEPATVGSMTFPLNGGYSLALLFSPVDGTLLSADALPNTFPFAAAADARGNTLIVGQYSDAITIGSTALSSPGPAPQNEALFIAALDGDSRAEGAQRLGASGNTQAYGIAVAPSGRAVVAVNTDTAFTSAVGQVQKGTFVAVFDPDLCALDAGPLGSSTGDASNHGDLPADGAAYTPNDAAAAACPATMSGATNGAACPVAMGCAYSSTCCFCTPTACNGQPTTWTCDPLGTPNTACPSSPPAAGVACPAGVQCNYCLPGGRYFADCSTGAWNVGFAQLLCN
jgi:hypothetical protein